MHVRLRLLGAHDCNWNKLLSCVLGPGVPACRSRWPGAPATVWTQLHVQWGPVPGAPPAVCAALLQVYTAINHMNAGGMAVSCQLGPRVKPRCNVCGVCVCVDEELVYFLHSEYKEAVRWRGRGEVCACVVSIPLSHSMQVLYSKGVTPSPFPPVQVH